MITKKLCESDADIVAILNGSFMDGVIDGLEDNHYAAVGCRRVFEIQAAQNRPTSMADVIDIKVFLMAGKEIDVAVVVAMLYSSKSHH